MVTKVDSTSIVYNSTILRPRKEAQWMKGRAVLDAFLLA
jgi:hypothetical protein